MHKLVDICASPEKEKMKEKSGLWKMRNYIERGKLGLLLLTCKNVLVVNRQFGSSHLTTFL